MDEVGVLFIGDIVGRPGRSALRELLPGVVGAYSPDVVIANGENSAGGFGLTPECAKEIRSLHVDVITTGNHVWDRKDSYEFINKERAWVLRPHNYPPQNPGSGMTVFECAGGAKVGVLNLSGRVFMGDLDCPFRVGDEALSALKRETPVVFVDMHAETTSEKAAIAHYFDGRASAVVGTHTHVQTSDERILPGGTAFITDAGMTGPIDSVIGMKKDAIVERFLTQMPVKFEIATKGVELQGVFVKIDATSGRALKIERIKKPLSSE